MIARTHPIDVLFAIAPNSLLLDIAGPAEAFRLANLHRAARTPTPDRAATGAPRSIRILPSRFRSNRV